MGIAVWLVALAAGVIATPARGLLVWPQTWFGAAIALDRRLATARFLALAFVLTTAF